MSFRRITFLIIFFLTMFLCATYIATAGNNPSHKPTPVPTERPILIQTTPTAVPPTPTPVVIKPAPTPPVPTTSLFYTVESGDTLEKIANTYGVSWLDLANLNQITDPNFLTIGQVLIISFNPADYKSADPYYKSKIIQVEGNTKHILIVLSEQKLYLYEGNTQVANYLISSGVASQPTVTGIFKIWIKLKSSTMSGPGYSYPDVLWTMYFYKDYGIHGTYWHNNFGAPMSSGCVNMRESDAEIVFNWASVDTIVQILP